MTRIDRATFVIATFEAHEDHVTIIGSDMSKVGFDIDAARQLAQQLADAGLFDESECTRSHDD